MKLDYQELYNLLRQDSIVTYKMQHQLFFAPMGTEAKIWFGDGAAMLFNGSLHMYGNETGLDKFLSELISGQEYEFFGAPSNLLPLLHNHFQDIRSEEDCTAYTISREDFSARSEDKLESLTPADAGFVNEHWTYKHEGSLEFFEYILAMYPSSAIRIGGQLAGWAVCYDATEDMINLGSLRVLEQYRQQGLGRRLAVDLVAKVLDLGKTPMIHIVDSNIASKTLSMGIGFKPHREQIFWGSGIKK